jgi:uncharacterized repeat protein (TIGR03803 family)
MMKNRTRLGFALAMLIALAVAGNTTAHAQAFAVKYNFGSAANDPLQPYFSGIVAQGRDGNLYSTTEFGGANRAGTMFKVTPSGTLTLQYSFPNTDSFPVAGLTLGTDGDFYGAAASGGTSGYGTVFKIAPSGPETVLHTFDNTDGYQPLAPPIQGTDGNFYGTTELGGAFSVGTVYKITPAGKFTLLHSFNATDGLSPDAPLVQGTDGSFYGTTYDGGTSSYGEVFKITASGNLTVLYNFEFTHGARPISPVVQGNDGSFYGTTSTGGAQGAGVIFKITAAGTLTILHVMNGTTDGGYPTAGLVQATDGNFYGVNSAGGSNACITGNGCGTIFKISPRSPYAYSVLYNFDGTGGSYPAVTLVQHTNGTLYADTNVGGTGDVSPCTVGLCGVFFSFNAGLRAFVSPVSASGKVGNTIGILGQGFTGTTGVSFNGTPAAVFNVRSGTFLTATVPSGATTGFVIVTTPRRQLKSNKKFRVTH